MSEGTKTVLAVAVILACFLIAVGAMHKHADNQQRPTTVKESVK